MMNTRNPHEGQQWRHAALTQPKVTSVDMVYANGTGEYTRKDR